MKQKKTFEADLQRLEEILNILENEEAPLELMVAHYEEGMKISQELRKTLEDAELRIINVDKSVDKSIDKRLASENGL